MKPFVRTRKSIGSSKEVSSKAEYRSVMDIMIVNRLYKDHIIHKVLRVKNNLPKNNLLITFADRIQTIVPNETFNLEFGKFLEYFNGWSSTCRSAFMC